MHDSGSGPSPARRILHILPYLLLLLGFALRLYRIGYQSIWWDEARSIQVAQEGFGAVLNLPGSATWNHPPLHFAALAGWARLAGYSELGVRYLSLLLGLLLVPLTYRVGRRLFDRSTGLVAMALVAVAPAYVTYSQEARAYVALPVFYLLLLDALHRIALDDERPRLRQWITLVAAETLLIYAHYVTVLGLIYVNVFLLAAWLWRRGFSLRDWIASQIVALGLFVPWLLNLARFSATIRSRLGTPDLLAIPPNAVTFTRRIGGFLALGNLAAVDEGTGGFAVAALGAAFVLALALMLPERQQYRQTWRVLLHALGPLALSFAMWQVRPQAQPRYMLVFSIPLVLVMGRAMVALWAGRARERVAAGLLAVSAALAFGTGLKVQYFDEVYHKDDARGVAAYLDEIATADDSILVSPNDYSVLYYYDGPARIEMARGATFDAVAEQLEELTAGKAHFVLVRWLTSSTDPHELRPFLLERAGQLEAWQRFRGLDVRVYALDGPTGSVPHDVVETNADFGPLRLAGVWHEPEATTDGAVTVALRWELVEPVDETYKVAVTLLDGAGERLSSADVTLLNEDRQTTRYWEAGGETTNFYIVPVPVGTPPLPATLMVAPYDADTLERLPLLEAEGQPAGDDELTIGEVALRPGTNFERDPYGTRAGVHWETPREPVVAEGLRLEGFSVTSRPAYAPVPGESVGVWLRWRAVGESREAVSPILQLSDDEQVLVEVGSPLLDDLYPADQWRAGEVVVERREFTYPPVSDPLTLSVVAGEQEFEFFTMWAQLDTELPSKAQEVGVQIGDFAELAGYELSAKRVSADAPPTLTLYWRALNEAPLDTEYTVFTQLLAADGHLIAQHDSPPAGNSRPTTTWVGGEVIADRHTLAFADPAYGGPATLIVGLYDSETVTRVPAETGLDHVVLAARVNVRATGP